MTSTHTTPAYIPQIRLYQNWLRDQRGLQFDSYQDLWHWSTTEINDFWQSIWDYFDMQSPTPHRAALSKNTMPGGVWFEGAQTNYAAQMFRHVAPAHQAGFKAIISQDELGLVKELSWPELRRQVASLALHLQSLGVKPGDRVAAYLPNIAEAAVALLATVSVGGVWSICAPDMGTNAVLDRFSQIEPKVLIACDGVRYGGKEHDRLNVVSEMRSALTTVEHLILLSNLKADASLPDSIPFAQTIARNDASCRRLPSHVVAFRPPLVDCVFQRNHRITQAHRARPRRHIDRCVGTKSPAQRYRLQLPPQQLGRAVSLVQLYGLGDVECPNRRATQRNHLCDL
jgi:acetoacetyl-CoA synthetase